MVETYDTDAIRRSALKYQWMHNKDWTQMGEEGDPPVIVEGKGIRVTDSTGKTWIDASGGYYSIHVGYGREEIAYAAYEQMKRINFFPSGTTTAPVIQLCEKLAELTPGSLSRAYLNSGGSEANETAIKIAKAYHKRRGEHGRYKIISRRGSYHGTTAGVMWLGESSSNYGLTDFEPAYPGMLHAPSPNSYRPEVRGDTPSEIAINAALAIEDLILMHGPSTVAAVIGEPVAQPPGAVVPGDEYWPMVRDICDRYGVLLIADEIICGFGRTGTMFGMDLWDVVPDIMSVGKGISSSYLPLSATVVKEEIADYFGGEDNAFPMAVTASGHPVAAAAALKNIEIIEDENLVEHSAQNGAYFKGRLEQLKEDHPSIGDVRGIGMLMGIELVKDRETKEKFPNEIEVSNRLSEKFKEHGLILVASKGIITVAPPISTTREETDEIVAAFDASIGDLERELAM
jgi:adenosylmethionine-8-amino-7-oxononanoate aminotransferase